MPPPARIRYCHAQDIRKTAALLLVVHLVNSEADRGRKREKVTVAISGKVGRIMRICQICNKLMKRFDCSKCNGKGVLKRPRSGMEYKCDICNGSGGIYFCPNYSTHAQRIRTKMTSRTQVRSSSGRCPTCGGKGWIPSSSPSYAPFAGYAGEVGKVPCPSCARR